MGVFLGGLTSVFYGIADFLGGEGAKRVSATTVVLWAGVISLPLITITALVVGGDATARDLWIGAAAGCIGAFGLLLLFAGLAKGQAASVAPAAAVFSGVFPVVVAVVLGEPVSVLTWIGVAIAVPAIILCSWGADRGENRFGGVWYGLVAGLGFGGYTIVINQTGEASGLLPLIPGRAAMLVIVVLLSISGVWKATGFATIPKGLVIGNGLLDVSGNVALLLALRSGTLATVAVASSFYPAVTVLMARIVNSEHLRVSQVTGVVFSLVALAAIALG